MSPPNVLFLVSDEQNPDFPGHRHRDGDGEPVETPALDTLAARIAVFDAAYCPHPKCAPSRQCLLTGKERVCSPARNNTTRTPGGRPAT